MPAKNHILKLLKRDGPWCHYCGYEIRLLDRMSNDKAAVSRDHIIPRALGGQNEIDNLMLAHKFCNSVRALGFAHDDNSSALQKHAQFVQMLENRGYRRNPNFTGPVNHNITECPKHLMQTKKSLDSKTFFFTLGPVAFDIRSAPGRYSHVRISIGSKHLVGAGYLNE